MRARVQRLDRPPFVAELPPAIKRLPVLLSKSQAAQELGVSWITLSGMIERGDIKTVPIGESGMRVKIPIVEINKFREGNYGGQGQRTEVQAGEK